MSDTNLKRLRKKTWLTDLPDSIEIPPLGERTAAITMPIDEASVDDVSFAIQALKKQSSALHFQIESLRYLHDLARGVGAVGTARVVDAAASTLEDAP